MSAMISKIQPLATCEVFNFTKFNRGVVEKHAPFRESRDGQKNHTFAIESIDAFWISIFAKKGHVPGRVLPLKRASSRTAYEAAHFKSIFSVIGGLLHGWKLTKLVFMENIHPN